MLQLDPNNDRVCIMSTSAKFSFEPGRKLPRLRKLGAAYAVTFRLADSLPAAVTEAWRLEREEICSRAEQQGRKLSASEEDRLRSLFSVKVDEYLSAGHGECVIQSPAIAGLIEGALLHFDGDRYFALHWCLMPNHVHLILWPMPGFELDDILQAMKSFTAHQSNRKLKRKGEFWMSESYDHLIRDDRDLWHAVQYVSANPRKAGLRDWPWAGRKVVADGNGIKICEPWRGQFLDCVRVWEAHFAADCKTADPLRSDD